MKHALNRALLAAVLSVTLATSAWAGFDEDLAAAERGDYATALEEWLPLAEQGQAGAQYKLAQLESVPSWMRVWSATPEYQAAVTAYARGDYATVLRLMRPLAEMGEAKAQTFVGLLYYFGNEVPQSYAEATKWYRRAADQNLALAQANLGDMYWKGQGVSRDYAKALELWRRAAEYRGMAEARHTIPMTNIGLFYAQGTSVAKDMCAASRWWRKAAALEGGMAQNNLSIMFESGDHVPQVNVQALVWATLALKHMEPGQDDVASQAATRRDALAKRMTASQVAQAEKIARETPPAQLVAALPRCDYPVSPSAVVPGCPKPDDPNLLRILTGATGLLMSNEEAAALKRAYGEMSPSCFEKWQRELQ